MFARAAGLRARPTLLLAAYAYAAQIYCDFSGYTDMAIGLALLMGFVFPQNFDSPYRATGFRDFWRRWHMTLSRFLRDFLYIPLGGNRGGRLRDLPQPDDRRWSSAASGTARRGRSCSGAPSTAPGSSPSTRSAGGWAARPGLAALVRHLQPDRARLDPLPLAATSTLFGDFLGRLVRSGPGDAVDRARSSRAIALVIGLQLLPERPLEGLAAADRAPAARCCSAPALAVVILFVGATVPSQGVPPFIYFRF